MSIYLILSVSFSILCISKYTFAFQITECKNNKPVNEGSDFVLECEADAKINYVLVEHNQRKCNFIVTNYVMKAEKEDCDRDLRDRISVDQHCENNPNVCRRSPRNNSTVTIKKVLEMRDAGNWTFSFANQKFQLAYKEYSRRLAIFERSIQMSGDNFDSTSLNELSTKGCGIPQEFRLHNYLEAPYLMTSTAQWNGNEKKCYAYCFKRDDTPYCMCNPSLMHNEEFSILAGVFAALFSVIGLTLNILMVLALKPVAESDLPTLMVISLSFSDLVFCVFTLPLQSARFLFRDWVFGDTDGIMCKIFPVLIYGQTCLTLLNIAAITISRWISIFFPRRRIQRTKNHYFVRIIGIWILPLLILLPSLVGTLGRHELECNSRICTIIETEDGYNYKDYLKLIGTALPILILTVADVSIFIKMRKIKRRFKLECTNRNQLEDTSKNPGERTTFQDTAGPDYSDMYRLLQKKELEVIKMMVAIFVGFCLSYLPSFLCVMIDPHKNLAQLHIVSYIILWASPIINPIIYIVTNNRYREAFALLLTRLGLFKTNGEFE